VLRYRQFVADGLGMGKREDLTGGALRRSTGGWEALKELQLAKVTGVAMRGSWAKLIL
jgi:hypothetical protein